tara:strand:- start:3838 stop:4629 length:792 start_codon:yes stop_codon:yes gene_type:complete
MNCKDCGSKNILKESNKNAYTRKSLETSKLCVNCFPSSNLDHLDDKTKKKIQCVNYKKNVNCWRFIFHKDAQQWAKENGIKISISYINDVKPKILKEAGLCSNCYNESKNEPKKIIPEAELDEQPKKVKKEFNKGKFGLENYKSWEKYDKDTIVFYVYILLNNDGTYYAGQTKDITTRLYEHTNRHNTEGTKFKDPKIVFYETYPTRELACYREYEFKQLIENNPRKLDRIISENIYINNKIQKSNNNRTFYRKILAFLSNLI